MSEPAQHHAINYIEFTTTDIAKTKSFYERAFSWNFQDYGPDYISFTRDQAGIDGGFRKGDPTQTQSETAPLIVLYSQDLKATQDAIVLPAAPSLYPPSTFPAASASTSLTARETFLQSGPNSSSPNPKPFCKITMPRSPNTPRHRSYSVPYSLSPSPSFNSLPGPATPSASSTPPAPARAQECTARTRPRAARTAALLSRTQTC